MLEEKLVKKVAGILLVFSVVICCVIFYMSQSGHEFGKVFDFEFENPLEKSIDNALGRAIDDTIAVERVSDEQMEKLIAQTKSAEMEAADMAAYRDEQSRKDRIIVSVPAGTNASEVQVNWDYMQKKISLILPSGKWKNSAEEPVSGNPEHVMKVTYDEPTEDFIDSAKAGLIEGQTLGIYLDKVYEIKCSCTSKLIYIELGDLHDKYDYVVVIDAGHGGNDPGEVQSGYNEKDINLAIAMKLREKLEEADANIGVFCTRCENENPELANRASLANDTGADLFISIHCNSYEGSGASKISGVSALYRGDEKALAELMSSSVVAKTGAGDAGVHSEGEIKVLKDSQVPTVLVECGFMTCGAELKNLVSDGYQQKVAEGLYEGILEFLGK